MPVPADARSRAAAVLHPPQLPSGAVVVASFPYYPVPRRRSESGRGCAPSSATTFRCGRRGLIPLLSRPPPPHPLAGRGPRARCPATPPWHTLHLRALDDEADAGSTDA
jgi:hypothetical protein